MLSLYDGVVYAILIGGYFLYVVVQEIGHWWSDRKLAVPPALTRFERFEAELTSADRQVRMHAAEGLGEGTHPNAVGLLLAALDRDPHDAPVVLCIVKSLGRCGDPRALPALKKLTHGAHYLVMQEARAVVAAMQAKNQLLRSASSPMPDKSHLLRAASSAGETQREQLLRAAERRQS